MTLSGFLTDSSQQQNWCLLPILKKKKKSRKYFIWIIFLDIHSMNLVMQVKCFGSMFPRCSWFLDYMLFFSFNFTLIELILILDKVYHLYFVISTFPLSQETVTLLLTRSAWFWVTQRPVTLRCDPPFVVFVIPYTRLSFMFASGCCTANVL